MSGAAQARGIALLDRNRPDLALPELRQAIAWDPEDAYSYSLLASALLQIGEDDEAALGAATTAVGLEPEQPWAHRLRAIALGRLGRTREAREAAEEGVRLWPEAPEGLIVLSAALQDDGDETGALAAAHHAVRVAPASAGAAEQLGTILFRHERWREAEIALERSLALDPESASAHNNLAVARLRQGRRGEALEGLERAARTDPSLRVVHKNLERVGTRSTIGTLALVPYVVLGLGVLTGIGMLGSSVLGGLIVIAICGLLIFGVRLLVLRARPLSAASAAMIDDRRRARRFKPWRWDYSRVLALRPWWWLAFERMHPWRALGLNVAVLAAALAGRLTFIVVLMGLALPASVLRAWRWERRRRGSAGSWRPPAD